VEAQVYCAQAQMINPNIPEIHLTLAIVYYNTKQYERAVEEAQKSWELTDRMDLRTAKLYFLMLDRLGAIDKLVEELSGCIDYYAAQLAVVEDEISKINDDDALMIKAANRKKIVLTKLLHYALKCRVQSHVFLGEFDSAVKLYEESKTFAAAEEDDKFFDLLFNQKVVNFDNVVISKQLITKIARLSLHYDSERKKFIEQIDSKVTSVDEVSFFTICLLHKIKGVQLHQFRLNSLNQRDENSLRAYWTNTQMQLEGGSELQVIAKHWIPSSSS
jgi:tetratricopeptide (TPR) repeat protein